MSTMIDAYGRREMLEFDEIAGEHWGMNRQQAAIHECAVPHPQVANVSSRRREKQ